MIRTATSRSAGSVDPRLLDQLEHAAAEAAGHDALLEGHHQPLAARLVEDQLAVERLGEPGVDDADRPALGREGVGRLDRPRHDRPEPDEQEVAALAQDLAAADREDRRRRPAARPNPASRG